MKQNSEIIEFVRKTTEAITVMSETNKELREISLSLKEAHINHNTDMATNFTSVNSKLDNLKTIFVSVIIPLVGGILAIVGVKFAFNIP